MDENGYPAVFVDRDGTLIRDVEYLCRQEQLEIFPKVPEALRLLRDRGYKIVVVTNQSAVARGRLTESILMDIHAELLRRLAQSGAAVDRVYYCPHHPTEGFAPYRMRCDCRKPNTGMIRKAAEELGLALSRSYVIGDQITDMELAARSGATGVWIRNLEKTSIAMQPCFFHVAENLWEAARWITALD